MVKTAILRVAAIFIRLSKLTPVRRITRKDLAAHLGELTRCPILPVQPIMAVAMKHCRRRLSMAKQAIPHAV